MNKKRVAILLTVHNRKVKTLACLSNLYKQRFSDKIVFATYLTDDGCTDGTPDEVANKYPDVHIIKGNGNLYWNRGMWTAWKEAAKEDYDYYFWLNDDTFLYADALERLVSLSQFYSDKAIVVGASEDTKHTHITYGGRINEVIPEPKGQPQEVDYFNGNIVLIPRSVFRVLGNLDFYFTHSKGDFDYGMRAKEAGIKMIQVGEVLGTCDEHERIDKWCDPEVPFLTRWKAMWMPTGMSPHETFHLEKRHLGFMTASYHFVTILIRCCFPNLWLRLGK